MDVLLPVIIMFMDVAAPVIAEPAANERIATARTTRRPKMSAKRPLIGRTAVQAIVYADEIQAKEYEPWRSWIIEGRAVETDACVQETLVLALAIMQ